LIIFNIYITQSNDITLLKNVTQDLINELISNIGLGMYCNKIEFSDSKKFILIKNNSIFYQNLFFYKIIYYFIFIYYYSHQVIFLHILLFVYTSYYIHFYIIYTIIYIHLYYIYNVHMYM